MTASAVSSSEAIQVALGCDQNYYCGLLVTAVSMARNCSPGSGITFNVLDGGLTPESKSELERKCRSVHSNCSFNWINVNTARFDKFPKFLDKGKMTYARLLLPEWLPNCDHIIYCDVDFLWLADIAELWRMRDEHILLQSVADGAPDSEANEKSWFESHGYTYDRNRYFCAGLCMMNLAKMRLEHASANLLSFIEQNPDIKAHDQTALNIMCHGRTDVRMLPNKWQLRTAPLMVATMPERPVIHFAADTPWRSLFFLRLLTDFHLLWFKIEAQIRGISTWTALHERYSAFRIITSRATFLIASSSQLGRRALRRMFRVLGRPESFTCLEPFLKKIKIPKQWATF